MGVQRQLHAEDGFTLGAYEAMPEGVPQGGIVVVQEIFGVNSHIRDVVDGYAAEGYAAIAPQIFDRAKRDVELGYEGDVVVRMSTPRHRVCGTVLRRWYCRRKRPRSPMSCHDAFW